MAIIINGKSYSGNNIIVKKGKVMVDDKPVDTIEGLFTFNIEGPIQSITVDNCNKINVTGDAHTISSTNGDIEVRGDVKGNISNVNGDVDAKNIHGSVTVVNGDINV